MFDRCERYKDLNHSRTIWVACRCLYYIRMNEISSSHTGLCWYELPGNLGLWRKREGGKMKNGEKRRLIQFHAKLTFPFLQDSESEKRESFKIDPLQNKRPFSLPLFCFSRILLSFLSHSLSLLLRLLYIIPKHFSRGSNAAFSIVY